MHQTAMCSSTHPQCPHRFSAAIYNELTEFVDYVSFITVIFYFIHVYAKFYTLKGKIEL